MDFVEEKREYVRNRLLIPTNVSVNPDYCIMLPRPTLVLQIVLIVLCSYGLSFGDFNHSKFDALLKEHVSDGRVDYGALKNDKRLNNYLSSIATADSSELETQNQNVAFWTNVYNAYTLKLIADHFPIDSIMDIKVKGHPSPWDVPFATVANKNYTLNQIENEVIRPNWPDPRIHYALVCAANSCPQLRSEAYVAEDLDKQLDEQGRWFLTHRNSFDHKARTATLSKVYEWYSVDFGNSPQDTLRTIATHAEPSIRQELTQNSKAWKVSFSEWDWALNVKK